MELVHDSNFIGSLSLSSDSCMSCVPCIISLIFFDDADANFFYSCPAETIEIDSPIQGRPLKEASYQYTRLGCVCPIVAMTNSQAAKWYAHVGVHTTHSPFAEGTTRKRVRSSDLHATACAGWEVAVVPSSPSALVVAPAKTRWIDWARRMPRYRSISRGSLHGHLSTACHLCSLVLGR